MCCMIVFCDMLYGLHCSTLYYLLIVVILVQHPTYHKTCTTVRILRVKIANCFMLARIMRFELLGVEELPTNVWQLFYDSVLWHAIQKLRISSSCIGVIGGRRMIPPSKCDARVQITRFKSGLHELPGTRLNYQALGQLFQAPILILQNELTWWHSTEFTGTQPILQDKIEHSAISLDKHSGAADEFWYRYWICRMHWLGATRLNSQALGQFSRTK
jgi:hypothetical protein